jgi:hypothetical protein
LSFEQNQDLYHWNLDQRRNADNFIISGDNPYYDLRKNDIYAFRGSYTVQKGRNEFKSGLDFTDYHVINHDIFASTSNYYIYTYDVKPRAGAAYVQDKLEFQGMIMNLGLRLDLFDPNHKVVKDFDHPFDPPDSSVAISLPGGPVTTAPANALRVLRTRPSSGSSVPGLVSRTRSARTVTSTSFMATSSRCLPSTTSIRMRSGLQRAAG